MCWGIVRPSGGIQRTSSPAVIHDSGASRNDSALFDFQKKLYQRAPTGVIPARLSEARRRRQDVSLRLVERESSSL